jgi:hypothetical protein
MTAVIAPKSLVVDGAKWRVVATTLNSDRKVVSYVVERKKQQRTVAVEATKD